MIYLLKNKCPKCGANMDYSNAVSLGREPPDEPDVPWVQDCPIKRYDKCVNGHLFNIRPYSDGDEHYIYADELGQMIARLEAKLSDLKELKGTLTK